MNGTTPQQGLPVKAIQSLMSLPEPARLVPVRPVRALRAARGLVEVPQHGHQAVAVAVGATNVGAAGADVASNTPTRPGRQARFFFGWMFRCAGCSVCRFGIV